MTPLTDDHSLHLYEMLETATNRGFFLKVSVRFSLTFFAWPHFDVFANRVPILARDSQL